jgi:phospholipid-translocating ATPase
MSLFQVMIPLSLYVTLEMAKLMQVYHIHNDVHMYDPETNKKIECRALNISEEVGQVRVHSARKSRIWKGHFVLFG